MVAQRMGRKIGVAGLATDGQAAFPGQFLTGGLEMLVLTREENETIVVPACGLVIHLVQIKGKRARIGVEVAKDTLVLRGEILDRERPAAPQPQGKAA
jgi:carbon storage regulator CsrA